MKSSRKTRVKRFLAVKEFVMLSLVIISLGLLFLEHFEQLSPIQLHWVDVYEISISVIFLAEFFFEYYYARNRKLYVQHHWFYLLAAIPIPTQTFEILHSIRALRLLKLLKVFAHMRYERNTRLFE
jgi:voltage-gated potassium channel